MGFKIAGGNYFQKISIEVKIMAIMPKLWESMITASISSGQSGIY